jgi:hypothetical protein
MDTQTSGKVPRRPAVVHRCALPASRGPFCNDKGTRLHFEQKEFRTMHTAIMHCW